MFWGDIIAQAPQLIRKLPPDTIPLEVSICVGQTYTLNGVTFDHDTTDAFVPFNGTSSCGSSIDSVINLTLHVIDPIVPIFDTLNSLTQLCDSGDVTLVAIPQKDAERLLDAVRANLAMELDEMKRMKEGTYAESQHKEIFTEAFLRRGGSFQ